MEPKPAEASLRQRLLLSMIVVAAVFIVVAIAALAAVLSRSMSVQEARQIASARLTVERLGRDLADQDSAIRGYVITSDDAFLRGYLTSRDNAQERQADLTVLLGDRPELLQRLNRLSQATEEWREQAASRKVAAMRAGRVAEARSIVRSGIGERLFNGIQEQVIGLERDLGTAQARVRGDVNQSYSTVTTMMFGGLAVLLLVFVLGYALAWRWVLRPVSAVGAAARRVASGDLDARVPACGPAEMTQLGRDVETMRARLVAEGRAAREVGESLREMQARLQLVVDTLTDYVIVSVDAKGRFTNWSVTAERYTGLAAEQAIGRPIDMLYSEDMRASGLPAAHLAEIERLGRTESTTLWREPVTGRDRWLSVVRSAMRGPDGSFQGYAVIARDVTAAKQAEDELAATHQKLSDHARDLERLNRELGDANESLTAANKELEAFSYSVSHDLRAPLRAISGFSQILLEDYGGQLDVGARRYLEMVSDNANRMGALIDDLLSFSRLFRSPVAKRPVDMRELVHASWRDIEQGLEGRQVELLVGDLPTVPADPGLLRQVLVNLLSNAAKFTAEKPVARIEVTAQADPDGGEPVFAVRDNGAGFDPRFADRLFGVFQRLHSATEFPGTGVGLAIVDRIIRRHGGRIWATSEPGEGAVFFFTLGPETVPGTTAGIESADAQPADGQPAEGQPAEGQPAEGQPADAGRDRQIHLDGAPSVVVDSSRQEEVQRG